MDFIYNYPLYEAFIALTEGVTVCPVCDIGIVLQYDTEELSAVCDTCGQEFHYNQAGIL